MFAQLREGIRFVLQGFAMAKSKGIRPYMIVPLIANILIFSTFSYWVFVRVEAWLSTMDTTVDLPSWLDWLEPIFAGADDVLYWILLPVIILVMLFLVATTFTVVVHILISPFMGILAEKAERSLRPINYPELTILQITKRTLLRELVKLRYMAVRGIGLLLLTLIINFIPVVNSITPVLWFVFGSWMLAMQYLDLPADNNGFEFKETLALMKQNRAATMGFGGAVTLATATPILNWFIIPIAVAGGVAFWIAKISPREKLANQN